MRFLRVVVGAGKGPRHGDELGVGHVEVHENLQQIIKRRQEGITCGKQEKTRSVAAKQKVKRRPPLEKIGRRARPMVGRRSRW